MKMKRAVMMAVLAIALAALVVPIANMKTRAAGPAAGNVKTATPKALAGAAGLAGEQQAVPVTGQQTSAPVTDANDSFGKLPESAIKGMGLGQHGTSQKVKKQKSASRGVSTQSGTPVVLDARSALSAALLTNIGGRDNQFSEVTLIADWDGREDCTADREQKVDDFSGIEVDIDQTLTRTAISEHTFANGYNENVYYYGDSLGNVWVGIDSNPGINNTNAGAIDQVLQINLTTVLNAFGSLSSDDQITITGLGVNPVADLTSFANVNGAFAPFAGQTGEILYVSFWDTEGGIRLTTNNQLVRSGVLAFPIADLVSPAAAPPGILSPAGFPVQVGGAFGVAFSTFSNIGGLAVDDDGSVYFHQADLINTANGGNIVKIQSLDTLTNQDRSLATNGFITINSLNPTNGLYGNASGPANQINRFTNYSGTSTTFGNIVSLASGDCNNLFAAVSASFIPGDVSFTQLTQGLFQAPAAFASGLPSMVISFADCSGAFDTCTSPSIANGIPGTLPIADGFADVAQSGLTRTAGVNNFRVFVLGNGPDIRAAAGGISVVPGTPASVLKVDMQIDYTLHSGLVVNDEGTVFVISGGTPAGIGKNPSPMLGEILCFEDACPMDRRGDFVDLRGNLNPNPPASGGNVGDGDSDRFDHIFYQAPFDQITITPAGLAGLAGGHLLYTNRTRNRNVGTLANLPNGGTQGDDSTSGVLVFEDFDAGHQVAGGDDQNTPFRGDDDDGAGSPILAGPLSGGFEFVFGATGVPNGTPACAPVVWNGLFLNSNGSVTFGAGDTNNTPSVIDFRSGLPKIAPAWTDLNPASRAGGNLGTFPVQALGFANVNAFRVRWINVPEFGLEACGSSNTFGLTLYDDGVGIDENASQPLNPANPIGNNAVPFDLQEGPTDLRFVTEPNTGVLVGCNPRRPGSGHFLFDYCRMDLLGTADNPVLVGYSLGGGSALNPPGLCETNLSEVARAADNNPFGVINGQTASIQACLIGEGTEPHIFELFNDGIPAGVGSGGEASFATPDFDLRGEGNDAALCTPIRQRDLNRGKVGFFGVGCPVNPACLAVSPVGTIAVAPNQPAVGSAAAGSQLSNGARVATPTSGIINAVCNVQLNFLGCYFIPNEVTTICQGFSGETGIPLQRPGKTVTSALRLACDTNGDGINDSVTTLTGVNPLNINLVRGTLAAPGQTGFIGTAFPLACCGGLSTLTLTTTFTAGDNNIFGAFTLTSTCNIDLGVRAPIVVSVTPSNGDCALPIQDLLISGGCFILPSFGAAGVGSTNVTSVFAVESGNPNNVIQARNFTVLSPFLIDANFAFTSANAGKTFLIFVSGPNGTSQNLTSLPAGTAGCPAGFLGNQQGIQVTFKCNSATAPGGSGSPNLAVIDNITVDEQSLIISGRNFQQGAEVLVGGVLAGKVKYKGLVTGSNAFTKLIARKNGICAKLPGTVVIRQAGVSSAPFQVNQSCQ